MSIAALVRQLVDAGAAPEVIAIAVAAVEAAASGGDERKRRDRERKAAVRAVSADIPQTVRGTSAECPQPTPPASPPMIDNNSTPPSPSPKSSRGTRLPADWLPDMAGHDLAKSMLVSGNLCRSELEKFRDFWTAKPGAGGVKLDWNATWRNWVRSAAERLPSARAGPARSSGPVNHRMNALMEIANEPDPSLNAPTFDLDPGDYRAAG